jgi:protein-S-isoprenylcysteine O-methyltransferase Ste14
LSAVALALFRIGVGFALDWVLLLMLVSVPLVHFGVILREVRYLKRKFGDQYRRYQTIGPLVLVAFLRCVTAWAQCRPYNLKDPEPSNGTGNVTVIQA